MRQFNLLGLYPFDQVEWGQDGVVAKLVLDSKPKGFVSNSHLIALLSLWMKGFAKSVSIAILSIHDLLNGLAVYQVYLGCLFFFYS